jgi:hypothetical protein
MGVNNVVFSPDGKFLAGAGEANVILNDGTFTGTIVLWDTATWKQYAILNGHAEFEGHSIAFSPDSKNLASVYDQFGAIKIWDLASVTRQQGKVFTLPEREMCTNLVFSPDGRILACADTPPLFLAYGTFDSRRLSKITLWDTATMRKRATLSGHYGSMSFSPDSKILAVGSFNNTVTLWEVAIEPKHADLDLVSYLVGKWFEFDETTGDVLPAKIVLDNIYEQHNYDFLNVGDWTHVGILQSTKSSEEANRLLFEHYCHSMAWGGAFALQNKPMDQPINHECFLAMNRKEIPLVWSDEQKQFLFNY